MKFQVERASTLDDNGKSFLSVSPVWYEEIKLKLPNGEITTEQIWCTEIGTLDELLSLVRQECETQERNLGKDWDFGGVIIRPTRFPDIPWKLIFYDYWVE